MKASLINSYSTSNVFSQGIKNTENHHYQQALSNFTQVIKSDKNLIAAAYSNRCLVHLQLGNNQAAQLDCTTALKLNYENTEAYLNQGLAEYRLGNYDKALKAYQEVIKRDNNDYRAYYNQGLVHFAVQDYDKALEDYDKSLLSNRLDSTSQKALIYSDKGLVNLQMGNFSNAIADLTQSITLDPTNDRAYYNRACAYQRNQNNLAAIADLTQVIKLNPNFTQAYINRGLVQEELGLAKAAFQDFNIALDQFNQQGKSVEYQKTLSLINQLKQVISQSNRQLFS